jgi:hypothetical protein
MLHMVQMLVMYSAAANYLQLQVSGCLWGAEGVR